MLLLIAMAVLLTGCASTCSIGASDGNTVPATNFSNPIIDADMTNADRAKLVQLIDTATPHQQTSWQSTHGKNQYTFQSMNVFVNNQGVPCRKYDLTAELASFVFHTKHEVQVTACRMEDVGWQVVARHDVDASS